MSTAMIGILLSVGAILVIASLFLRVQSGGRYEFKTGDLVFLVIPLLLVSLATGKIKGLDLFGVKADLSALWVEAAQAKIEKQVAPAASASVQDVVHIMEMGAKGGTQDLQRLLQRRVEALEFRLGFGGYNGSAIQAYFDALSGSSQLRSIVVNNQDGTLFGMYLAGDLIGYLRVTREQGYAELGQRLNRGDETSRAELKKLPGFVGAEHAVTASTSKRESLARMEQLNVDSLPVVDNGRRFVGTVDRGKVTASLILAVTDKVENR
ncbi:MAG TPA: CBS domain-containing protein [Methylomirabilota bacterium]|nr:CBS domain-containing protein [Methylomirabilota bacterium]